MDITGVTAIMVMLMVSSIYLPSFVLGFAPIHNHSVNNISPRSSFNMVLFNGNNNNDEVTVAGIDEAASTIKSINDQIFVPKTLSEMVSQVSDAIRSAQESSEPITRQVVRILLPRDSKNAQLGQYYESEVSDISFNNIDIDSFILVPPDETWQGGIMQLYRAISIPTRMILRSLGGTVGGVPPKILEDRSIDSSNVDGVGIFQSQVPKNPSKDICCFVQPLQESIDVIESISDQAGKDRLVLLLNPQWRNVDDALDSASKQGGVLGSFASFLGGKGNSLKKLDNLGFTGVYTIEGYVCKGGNVMLMKRFDSDWVVFAENDSETDYIRIGEAKSRPSYQDVEKMLDDKGISLKYARDIGLAPKLE